MITHLKILHSCHWWHTSLETEVPVAYGILKHHSNSSIYMVRPVLIWTVRWEAMSAICFILNAFPNYQKTLVSSATVHVKVRQTIVQNSNKNEPFVHWAYEFSPESSNGGLSDVCMGFLPLFKDWRTQEWSENTLRVPVCSFFFNLVFFSITVDAKHSLCAGGWS